MMNLTKDGKSKWPYILHIIHITNVDSNLAFLHVILIIQMRPVRSDFMLESI